MMRTMSINEQNVALSLRFFMGLGVEVIHHPFKGKLTVGPAIQGTCNAV